MSTITQTSTGSIGLSIDVLNDPNFIAVAVFSGVGLLVSALGLLASFYFMSHFPSLVDDAASLAPYL